MHGAKGALRQGVKNPGFQDLRRFLGGQNILLQDSGHPGMDCFMSRGRIGPTLRVIRKNSSPLLQGRKAFLILDGRPVGTLDGQT